MGDARDQDWVRTLDEVEDAVRGCLAVLERYEAKFAELLREQGVESVSQRLGPVTVGSTAEWEARLGTARGRAAEAEQLLAEQELVWGRWREALTSWRQSVEHPPGAATHPSG